MARAAEDQESWLGLIAWGISLQRRQNGFALDYDPVEELALGAGGHGSEPRWDSQVAVMAGPRRGWLWRQPRGVRVGVIAGDCLHR